VSTQPENPTEPSAGGVTADDVVNKDEAERVTSLDPGVQIGQAQAAAARQVVRIRGVFASSLFCAMAFQLLVADFGLAYYGYRSGWRIPASVINAWLGATVIQVVVLVLAMTKFVFSREALYFEQFEKSNEPSSSISRPAAKGFRAAWRAYWGR
jgi:hypothetical protein